MGLATIGIRIAHRQIGGELLFNVQIQQMLMARQSTKEGDMIYRRFAWY
jgi:hypothetical protein